MKAIFALALFLCSIQGKRAPKLYTTASFEQDSDDKELYTIKARAGRRIIIELPSNPSTGYFWTVTNQKDLRILKLTSKTEDGEYILQDLPKGYAGRRGVQQFAFYPKRVGTEVARLELKRSPGENPISVYKIRVIMQ
eukprot:TRINITY_DN10397_c0_g2_i14.p1 TRINITY_DN10397_c0_g2~~TRINITY_DN10397_c0_g2_i14.p1  ORF type:complete len:138 (+),score=14.62 TRINITY_DN10397_c0_g2_i14:135-548(+)